VIQECAFLNEALGVATIAPWNINQIPEHWIQMIIAGKTLEASLSRSGKTD
jgi:hypothetical protein